MIASEFADSVMIGSPSRLPVTRAFRLSIVSKRVKPPQASTALMHAHLVSQRLVRHRLRTGRVQQAENAVGTISLDTVR